MTAEQSGCDALQIQTIQAPLRAYSVATGVVLAAQPQPDDWQRLAEQGFDTIINIRSDPARAAMQQQSAQQAGLRYIHAPLPAYELTAADLAEFARIVEQPRQGKLCIHCRSATRVGLLWLLYRVVHQGWSPEAALHELRAAGYDEGAMETFEFCAADFFERTGRPERV